MWPSVSMKFLTIEIVVALPEADEIVATVRLDDVHGDAARAEHASDLREGDVLVLHPDMPDHM